MITLQLLGVLIVIAVPTAMLAWSLHTGGWRDTVLTAVGAVVLAALVMFGFALATGAVW